MVNSIYFTLIAALAFGAVYCQLEADCVFDTDEGAVFGNLFLYQDDENSSLVITGVVGNVVPDGLHGFHVHQFGNLSDSCKGAGAHYNPFNVSHGGPDSEIRHVGDLGNIEVNIGSAILDIVDPIASLYGEHSILGRSLVIHEGEDDLGASGDPSGNSGTRIGCCKIVGLA